MFHTTNLKILCQKLQHCGIQNTALSWIKSFLEYRTQLVQFGYSRCYILKISCGVPQSSILAPLLFIIYVSDLPNVSSQTQSLLIADDTNFFFVPIGIPTTSFLLLTMNRQKIEVTWLQANKLSLNLTIQFFIQGKRKYIYQCSSCYGKYCDQASREN